MYCPNCKCEYIEGYTFCKECEEKLVHELQIETHENNFVVFKSYEDNIIAEMDKGILTSNGIDSIITGISIGRGSLGLNRTVPIQLLVDKSDIDKVKDILIEPNAIVESVDKNSEPEMETEEINKIGTFLIKGFVYTSVFIFFSFLIYGIYKAFN